MDRIIEFLNCAGTKIFFSDLKNIFFKKKKKFFFLKKKKIFFFFSIGQCISNPTESVIISFFPTKPRFRNSGFQILNIHSKRETCKPAPTKKNANLSKTVPATANPQTATIRNYRHQHSTKRRNGSDVNYAITAAL